MSRWIPGVVLVGVLVVIGLLWQHDRDARADGRIAVADSLRRLEQHRGDSLAKVTDSLARVRAVAVDTFTAHDTVWQTFTKTVPKLVDRIVHDTAKADTTKIVELAQLVLETKAKADTDIAAARAVVAIDLEKAFAVERASWVTERATAAGEIALLKRQARHWGLCATGGYGLQRSPTGSVQAGPVLALGVCYRY